MATSSDAYRVQSSGDKGNTWTNQVAGCPAEVEFDKEMTAADDVPTSPYANTLYTAWTVFGSGGSTTIKVNHSTDRLQSVRGQSFSAPVTLVNPTSGRDTGTNVQTGPNGEVYVCWADYPTRAGAATGIGFTRSTDGGNSFTSPSIAFTKTGIEVNSIQPDPLFNNTRVNDFPSMAVDKSNGSHRGRIYIVYLAKENGVSTGKAVIQVRYSDNKGTSWSPPVTTSIANGRQNWFPWIAVDDTNGDVSIAYYSLDGPSGFATNTYVAYSGDGGNSFCNLKVSDVSHIPVTSAGGNVASGYTGDYIGITAYGGKAYPTWADNRTGTSTWQLYTSPVAYAITSGPAQLCVNNTATYSTTLITGASVRWSSSDTGIATINSSTGVATGVAQGNVNFFATITTSCGTTIYHTKYVQVGPYPATGTYSNGPYGTRIPLSASYQFVPTGNTYYIWMDQPFNFTFTTTGPNGTAGVPITRTGPQTAYFYFPGSSVQVNASAPGDPCGASVLSSVFAAPYGSFAMTPNPASSELTVTNTQDSFMSQYKFKNAEKASVASASLPFDADLYDMYGRKVKSQANAQGKVVFNVNDLPEGLYSLRVGKGKDIHTEHVQITH